MQVRTRKGASPRVEDDQDDYRTGVGMFGMTRHHGWVNRRRVGNESPLSPGPRMVLIPGYVELLDARDACDQQGLSM